MSVTAPRSTSRFVEVAALFVALLLALSAPLVGAHETSSGWGGAFQERIGLSDEQYAALIQHKKDTESLSDEATALLDQLREALIQSADDDISSRAEELIQLLGEQVTVAEQFFVEFSGELSEAQRASWVEHTRKRKQKKDEGKLPKQ